MSIAKIIEVSARSSESFEAAIAEGITKAGDSVRGIREAWVKDMKVQVTDGRVDGYQVELKITFVVD
jgi:flavin-binding protein dodecin